MKNNIARLVAELSDILKVQDDEPVSQAGPATEDTIQAVEQKLGVTFPDDYRFFLKTLGAISISDAYFFGIWDKEGKSTRDATVLGETLNLRESGSLPNFYVPFHRVVYDLYACLNCSPIDSEHKIVYFEPSRGIYECNHAKTFAEYVENYLNAYITEIK